MWAPASPRERAISENSLVLLLQGLRGLEATVDLRDESAATGRVANVDAFMNIRLAPAALTDRRGRRHCLEQLLVAGRSVRYVHLPDGLDVRATLQAQLRLLQRLRRPAPAAARREFPTARRK
ncbi:U7 snRNA-associated Sm-like protein LSm10 [Alligator mississippiensis]|uniref:U7 snRNA-associated Sm-like protein LSm10 n=1 Tax=Alligator mississippiensis TaxID=8496 RepID=UPI0003D08AD1|nr:U7 snRNA-associated Sm-like protein LSm10 [Alligator mississippiensis]